MRFDVSLGIRANVYISVGPFVIYSLTLALQGMALYKICFSPFSDNMTLLLNLLLFNRSVFSLSKMLAWPLTPRKYQFSSFLCNDRAVTNKTNINKSSYLIKIWIKYIIFYNHNEHNQKPIIICSLHLILRAVRAILLRGAPRREFFGCWLVLKLNYTFSILNTTFVYDRWKSNNCQK